MVLRATIIDLLLSFIVPFFSSPIARHVIMLEKKNQKNAKTIIKLAVA